MISAVIIVVLLVALVLVDTSSAEPGAERRGSGHPAPQSNEEANSEAGSRCILSIRTFLSRRPAGGSGRARDPARPGRTENTPV